MWRGKTWWSICIWFRTNLRHCRRRRQRSKLGEGMARYFNSSVLDISWRITVWLAHGRIRYKWATAQHVSHLLQYHSDVIQSEARTLPANQSPNTSTDFDFASCFFIEEPNVQTTWAFIPCIPMLQELLSSALLRALTKSEGDDSSSFQTACLDYQRLLSHNTGYSRMILENCSSIMALTSSGTWISARCQVTTFTATLTS